MSALTHATAADHFAAAYRCQEQPGTEILVNVYRNKQGADAVARGVNTGKFPAYRPAGTFLASAHPHEQGWAVWARCTDGLDLEPLPETMTVRVPDYGRQAGYEGVRVVEVEISARCQTCGGPRGETRPDSFVRDGVRHVRDVWTNPCGHPDDYRAVLKEARRRTEPPRHGEPRGGEIEPVDGGKYAKAVTLLAEWLAENPWLSAQRAVPMLNDRRQYDAALTIRQFATTSLSGPNTSAKSAALYLVHLDTEARDADTSTTTGDTK
ncbi:hypothetical protein [Streptomyces afghaniensis]|uniref:hypothetical protein n=1 Tax=Streptomyces afghaniensis TaxID=66865 RepID=UPI00278B39B1|nr:hypothetical protein [Streptomyces afghaniensis]MDQ1018797.1 hypothetical protein [Streptomyces afghaniensis]